MNLLFFDTETTGFFDDRLPPDDPKQPYLVQLACRLENETQVLGALNCRVQLNGVNQFYDTKAKQFFPDVPPGAYNVHGINKAEANSTGIDPLVALACFHQMATAADVLIAHNAKYDMGILRIAYARKERLTKFVEEIQTKTVFCTMMSTIDIVKAPGRGSSYKWPKLEEAYAVMVDSKGFEGAHDAMNDVMACRAVYHALKKSEN